MKDRNKGRSAAQGFLAAGVCDQATPVEVLVPGGASQFSKETCGRLLGSRTQQAEV